LRSKYRSANILMLSLYNSLMAIMDIQVSPRLVGTISVSEAVVEAHKVIIASGLKHVLTPMGTCIEGDFRVLYQLAADIHARMIELGYPRIGVAIKIDDRRDKPQSMLDKVRRVEDQLTGLDGG
jgi:uncharacterized protein (TIGR00106 family)